LKITFPRDQKRVSVGAIKRLQEGKGKVGQGKGGYRAGRKELLKADNPLGRADKILTETSSNERVEPRWKESVREKKKEDGREKVFKGGER